MGRIARAGTVALIAAAALALGPAAAQAALLDANCPGPSGPSFGVNANERYAQPFTALHSGTVARAQIDVSKPGAGDDFQLQILNTDAGGTPVDGILASATIPDASVPVGTSTLAATFPAPPNVVAGTRYALVATRPGGSTFNVPESSDVCPGRDFRSSSQTGVFSPGEPGANSIFQIFVNPTNAFTIGKLKGRKLHLNLPGGGAIVVGDGTRAPGAVPAAAAGKKLLRRSTANATGPGDAVVKLRLTKRAKALLREKGRLKVRAEITFTPTGGEPSTRRPKLKLK